MVEREEMNALMHFDEDELEFFEVMPSGDPHCAAPLPRGSAACLLALPPGHPIEFPSEWILTHGVRRR